MVEFYSEDDILNQQDWALISCNKHVPHELIINLSQEAYQDMMYRQFMKVSPAIRLKRDRDAVRNIIWRKLENSLKKQTPAS